jgi:hypothetical protein
MLTARAGSAVGMVHWKQKWKQERRLFKTAKNDCQINESTDKNNMLNPFYTGLPV